MSSEFLPASSALAHLKTYKRSDGLSLRDLVDSQVNGGLTYNDILVLPGHINFPASEVSLESRITKKTVLKTPFLSSPMDTVTETEMAISMAVSVHYPWQTHVPQKRTASHGSATFFLRRISAQCSAMPDCA